MNTKPIPMKFFFITGAHKSGTSWLSNMLREHNEISIPKQELWLFGHKHSLINDEMQANVMNWLQLPTVSQEYKGKEDKIITSVLRFMVAAILRQRVTPQIKAVGDKTPLFTALEYKRIYQLFPDAFFIHIYRDCRDVLISHIFHNLRLQDYRWYPSKEYGQKLYKHYIQGIESIHTPALVTDKAINEVAKNWNLVVNSCFEAKTLFKHQYIAIKYETLLVTPELIMQNLFASLGVSNSNIKVKNIVESQGFENITHGRKQGNEDRMSFFRKGIIGDWKNYLTDKESSMIYECCDKNMKILNYEN